MGVTMDIMHLVKEHRKFFIFEGFFFIILGILAIILPGVMTLGVELFVGWLFLIGGVIQGIRAFSSYRVPGFFVSLFSAILSVIVGVLLLVYPLSGIITLTLMLTAFFFVDGIFKIIFSFRMRPHQSWGTLLISGILSLALAFIIWSGWPGTAVWAIGLLVGINMLFTGCTMVYLGWNAKTASE